MKKNEFIKIGYKERYESFFQLKKRFIIFLLASIFLFLLDFVLFLIIVQHENFNLVYFINLPIFVLITISVTYFIIGLVSIKKELKFLSSLFSNYINIIDGFVAQINDIPVSLKNRKLTEIAVIENQTKYLLFFDNCFGNVPFNVNDKVALKIADNFILEYEIYESKSNK